MAQRRHILLGGAAALASAALGRGARAADYPDRPVRIVVPFPPGGNLDFTARLIAPPLQQILGQPVVIDNRAGAAGVVGTDNVAKSRPDGYSLLIGSSGPISLLPATTPTLPFDPIRDFAPVAPCYRVPIAMLVSKNMPATLAAFIEHAKAKRGEVTAGTSGIGSGAHLAIELLNASAGTGLLHVPYRGTGPAFSDLIAGTIDSVFDQLSTALPLHRDGRARILAVGSARRMPMLPDVPTFREAGLVQPELTTTLGMLAPAGTPPEIIEKLRAAMATILGDAAMKRRLEDLGAEVPTGNSISPAAYAAIIADELETSRRAVALPGVKLTE